MEGIKYFEIPVTTFDMFGAEEFKTYYAKGEESRVALLVHNFLSSNYYGEDYDYDLVETSEVEFMNASPEQIILPGDNTTEDILNDVGLTENQIGEILAGEDVNKATPLPVKDVEDEMEDLQNDYYVVMDEINAIPLPYGPGTQFEEPSGAWKDMMQEVQTLLLEAREAYDQYDFIASREKVDRLQKLVPKLQQESNRGRNLDRTVPGNWYAKENFQGKTADNYEVLGIYKADPRKTDKPVAIIHRQPSKDFVVAWNYDIFDGTWGQGYYGFDTQDEAYSFASKRYGIGR